MFSFFSRKHRHTTDEVALIFDIGSGSVGAALALLSSLHKPMLLATERIELPFQETCESRRLQPLMLRALSEAVLSLLAEGIPRAGLLARRLKVTDAFYILAAPWCSARTKTLSLAQKEPLRITEEVLSELVRHEDAEKAEDSDNAASPKQRKAEERRRFERVLLHASLNGYDTTAPLGKEARTAAFSFFESYSPSALLHAIENTVAHFVHPHRTHFHSYALASFSALLELFPDTGDFLLADIGGEITEVLSVRTKILRDTFSFPLGRNHLVRALARATSSSSGASQGLLSLAREKQIHTAALTSVDRARAAFCADWRAHLTLASSRFSPASSLSFPILLSADADCADFFADCLKSTEAAVDAPPVVTVLQAKHFRQLVTLSAAGAAEDTFLMLETVYADQLQRRRTLFAY